MRPKWLTADAVIALHDAQIAEHGGEPGLRNFGLLESALNRPRHIHRYGCDDIVVLAAAYAGGIVQNHPFLDGNKRASLLATVTFLALNGLEPTFSDEDAASWWLSLAAGTLSESELAELLRTRMMRAP